MNILDQLEFLELLKGVVKEHGISESVIKFISAEEILSVTLDLTSSDSCIVALEGLSKKINKSIKMNAKELKALGYVQDKKYPNVFKKAVSKVPLFIDVDLPMLGYTYKDLAKRNDTASTDTAIVKQVHTVLYAESEDDNTFSKASLSDIKRTVVLESIISYASSNKKTKKHFISTDITFSGGKVYPDHSVTFELVDGVLVNQYRYAVDG